MPAVIVEPVVLAPAARSAVIVEPVIAATPAIVVVEPVVVLARAARPAAIVEPVVIAATPAIVATARRRRHRRPAARVAPDRARHDLRTDLLGRRLRGRLRLRARIAGAHGERR
jgi:hypothetical protein